jgi:hypothetical protein
LRVAVLSSSVILLPAEADSDGGDVTGPQWTTIGQIQIWPFLAGFR